MFDEKKYKKYLTTGQSAKEIGVSIPTIRSMIKKNILHGYKTNSNIGHWRIAASSVRKYLTGYKESQIKTKKSIAIYARVSSSSQKNSIDRQINRITDFIINKESISKNNIRIFKDIDSGYAPRIGLHNLMKEIMLGNITKLYCENYDRLSRGLALASQIDVLLDEENIELILLEPRKGINKKDILMEEIQAIMTCIVNMEASERSTRVTKKIIDDNIKNKITKFYLQGYSITKILDILISENTDISYYHVDKICKENCNINNTTSDWIKNNLKKNNDKKRLTNKQIRDAYINFCITNNIEPISISEFGKIINNIFPGTKYYSKGQTTFRGLELITYNIGI